MWTFLPFSTTVLATHLGGPETPTAVAFYCATFVFGNITFSLLFETVACDGLFRSEVDAKRINGIRRSFRMTGLFYVAATLMRWSRRGWRSLSASRYARACSTSGTRPRSSRPDWPLCQMRPKPLKSNFLPRVIPRARSVP
ncbi:MAG: hypothetical protein ACM4AI_07770, partial [Acidobacteriota bacterium]